MMDDEVKTGAATGDEEDDEIKKEKKKKKKPKRGDKTFHGIIQNQADSIDICNLYSRDPNKLDIINNLNSIKLLQLKEQFELMPGECVDVEQFVKLMDTLLEDSNLARNDEEFVTVLVDLFYRINKKNNDKFIDTIEFEDITTYLIEHEIAFDAMASGTEGGGTSNNQIN